MPQVTVTRSALTELRERISGVSHPSEIWIMGPSDTNVRGSDSIEDSWLLEKLYGPRQRWIVLIMPLGTLQEHADESGEIYAVENVGGIPFGLVTNKKVTRLNIELFGDAIRVHELDP